MPDPGGILLPTGGNGTIRLADARRGLPQSQRTQVDLREVGVSGTRLQSGQVFEDPNVALQGQRGLRLLQQMSMDPTVAAALRAVELPIRAARWYVEPASEDPKHVAGADFVHWCLWEFGAQSMDDVLRQALSMLWAGFSVSEIVYDIIEDGEYANYVGWDKLAWRHPLSKYLWNVEEIDSRSGSRKRELVSMTQQAPPTYEQIVIPREKLLLWVHNQLGENYDGTPCALDTVIPTPEGWSTIGSLQIGDAVFDETGAVRKCVAKSPVFDNKPCYEVIFNSGERVVTSGDHQWDVRTFQDRKHKRPARQATTAEMAEVVKYVGMGGKSKIGSNQWSVRSADVLKLPSRDLPVEPYALGLWLGDGSTNGQFISAYPQDFEDVRSALAAAGHVTTVAGDIGLRIVSEPRWSRPSFAGRLRLAGVFNNKHVPAEYLRASKEQRLALLQGLMDSDGCAYAYLSGLCVFTNANRGLVDSVAELVSTLGCCWMQARTQKPSKSHMLNGHPVIGRKPIHQLIFSLPVPAFRINRKIRAQSLKSPRRDHYITAINPVATVPVQCITTDAPSHLFLVGKRMIPTHNSLMRQAYQPWVYKDSLRKIQAIGLERSYVGIPHISFPEDFSASEVAAATQIGQNMRVSENAAVIAPEHIGVALLTNKIEGRAMQDAIDHHDTAILMSILAQFVQLGTKGVGSYSLSTDQSELFLMAIGAVANYTAQVFNLAPGIPTLMRYNFAGVTAGDMPRLVHGPIGQRNFERLARGMAYLSQWGILTPDDSLEDWTREQMEMPERDNSVTDEALRSLIETVAGESQYPIGHPGPRYPIPGTSTGLGVTIGGQPVAPPAAADGATPSGAEITTSAAQNGRQAFNEMWARRQWERPQGRLTDVDRNRIRATETFAGALADMRAEVGQKPERPSVRLSRTRRPYQIRMSEPTPEEVVRKVNADAKAGRLRHAGAAESVVVPQHRVIASQYEGRLSEFIAGLGGRK